MNRINTENLRNCVERDFWYNSALGRLTQRGTRPEDQNEGAEVEADPAEVASAPHQTPPTPIPAKSVYIMSKPIDIPNQL